MRWLGGLLLPGLLRGLSRGLGAAVLLLAAGCPAADDDDSAGVEGCVARGSGGSGGAAGTSWLTVPGWSTDDGGDLPDYEVVVYRPEGLAGPAPLAVFTNNPVEGERAVIEGYLTDIGSGFDAWADEHGYVVAYPVAGGVEGGELGFRTGQDEPYMGAAIDAVAAAFDVDLNSVHLFGRSGGGRLAIQLAQAHAEAVASILSLAGPQPFPNWETGEPTWSRPVGGLFVHDEADPIVGRPTVLDTVAMFQAQGAEVETFFDYTGGHDWLAEEIEPRMAAFFGRTCLE